MKHVKSNAITIAKDGRLLGMGSGQPNRVNSVRIALEKAADEVQVSRGRWMGVCRLYTVAAFACRYGEEWRRGAGGPYGCGRGIPRGVGGVV